MNIRGNFSSSHLNLDIYVLDPKALRLGLPLEIRAMSERWRGQWWRDTLAVTCEIEKKEKAWGIRGWERRDRKMGFRVGIRISLAQIGSPEIWPNFFFFGSVKSTWICPEPDKPPYPYLKIWVGFKFDPSIETQLPPLLWEEVNIKFWVDCN